MKQNKILPAVAVAIFNEKGHILLQRRSDRNLWGLISGHVEFGESVKETALREIQEETGLQAKITRLIGVYSQPETQTYGYPTGETVHYITTYFQAILIDPFNENFTCNETLELKFFPPDQLPDNLLVMNPYWLKDALTEQISFIR